MKNKHQSSDKSIRYNRGVLFPSSPFTRSHPSDVKLHAIIFSLGRQQLVLHGKRTSEWEGENLAGSGGAERGDKRRRWESNRLEINLIALIFINPFI